MTFKDLKLQLSKLQSNTNQDNRLDIFRNKPFWIWDKEHHKKEYQLTNGKCCLNHILQCPINQKTGLPNPMFDYEKTIYDTLQQHKHIFILKSTGLGITEFFLRYIAWLCLKDDTLNPEAKNMLIHTKESLEYEKKVLVDIHPKFDKLIVALRTAVSDDQGKLDKDRLHTIMF